MSIYYVIHYVNCSVSSLAAVLIYVMVCTPCVNVFTYRLYDDDDDDGK